MCGLLGEVTFGCDLSSPEIFNDLLSLSSHRGPDVTQTENIANKLRFGFNRLSIIDPSENSHQPIWSPSKRYLIVYNGEIYNHAELRTRLSGKGENIKGYGDTPTLAKCFDEWGIEKTISNLDGMFAIGVWDDLEKKISLVRDFAGVKPLYYGFDGRLLVFSSQYNQISRHPSYFHNEYENSVLKLYLIQHYIPSPNALIKNTFSLNPGEIITFNIKGEKFSKEYWNYPDYEEIKFSKNEAVNHVEKHLKDAVKSELISDVPIGAFLSGGVDSPLICYFASLEKDKNFKTFSIGSDSKKHDETTLSSHYANFLNTVHSIKTLDAANTADELEKAVSSIGEPFGDYSLIPMWQMSKRASKSVKVSLSGDGGDELFFGYERFQSIAKNYHYWRMPFALRYILRGLDKIIFNEQNINECILSDTPGDSHFGLHSHVSRKVLDMIAPSIMEKNLPINFETYKYSLPKTSDELMYLIRKAEFYGMLQRTLLKVDRASMAHGLEVRVPFLKKSFIEQIFKLGIPVHSPNRQRKRLLYELLGKKYPHFEHEKNKKGFSISLSKWIKEDYKDMFYDTLLEKKFCERFGFNKNQIERVLDSHVKGLYDFKWLLFSLYSLSIWFKFQTIVIERP